MLACSSPSKSAVQLAMTLRQYGADLDAQDVHGQTALLRAARASRADVIEFLVAEGADLLARSRALKGASAADLMPSAVNAGMVRLRERCSQVVLPFLNRHVAAIVCDYLLPELVVVGPQKRLPTLR